MQAKIAITMNQSLLTQLDELVVGDTFKSRSQAVQEAVREMLTRLRRGRLARECAKLDPAVERELAEEGLDVELATWPEY
jgi:Arc/MetJ-type ribon-helix-helix transcriptional regulator